MESTYENGNSDNRELEKSKSHILREKIEYVLDSIAVEPIIRKSFGNINLISFDKGQGLRKKAFPFETFVQIIEGKAEIVIDNVSHHLETGEGIVIAANTPNSVVPNGRFKMIWTIINKGID